jgi:hypothetical protein
VPERRPAVNLVQILRVDLERVASHRPPGYLDYVLARAHPGTANRDIVEFTPEVYAELRVKFAEAAGGPGTELKKLLGKIGITASPTCSCNARARQMDERGIQWCRDNLDEIAGWLAEEAKKRNLPFVRFAGKKLVQLAISRAEKAGRAGGRPGHK